ncbi:MAG: PepSY domain-containing protein [Eubacteriales bacterium]|nr:PepSY domain-containing protein [Eubacteriales bacterium]
MKKRPFMKKIIVMLFAVLTLSALTVPAFAVAGDSLDTKKVEAEQQASTTQQEDSTKQEGSTQQDQAATEISAKLSEADALAAALKDAGQKEADVTVSKNKLSEKQTTAGTAVAVYTVHFKTVDTSYKYILDANTGAVYCRDVRFQSADVVFKGRGHGGKDGSAETGSRPGKGKHGGKKNTSGENTNGGSTGKESTGGESTNGGSSGEGTADGQDAGVI